jgi:hypothetical protein
MSSSDEEEEEEEEDSSEEEEVLEKEKPLPRERYVGKLFDAPLPGGAEDKQPKYKAERGHGALMLFTCLFPVAFFRLLAENTNKYRRWMEEKDKAGVRAWTDTTPAEIEKFVAILMFMGVEKLPQTEDYWAPTEWYHSKFCRKIMTLFRFQQLKRFFHVSDVYADERASPEDKDSRHNTYKVEPIWSRFKKLLRRIATAGSSMTVDESVIAYHGRHGAWVLYFVWLMHEAPQVIFVIFATSLTHTVSSFLYLLT